MFKIPKKTVPRLIRGLKILGALIATLQAITVSVIVAIDQLRKLRQTGKPDGYPRISAPPMRVDRSCLNIYMDGETLYRDMLAAIEGAKERVFFETFIWKSDEIGQEFKDALIRAAERGAEVYIIWDRFGNLVVDPRFFRFPRLKNLHVLRYSLKHTARDHRKILVVDSRIGFVGGYNIGSYYVDNQWRDTHLRIKGPNVWELESAFLDFWNYAQKWHLRLKKVRDPRGRSWNSKIQGCVNDPKRLLFPVRGMYVNALDKAQESAYITSAYFVPDRVIQRSLIDAARRGVDVKVLVPAKSNHIIADWISRSYLTDLLDNQVELWLYDNVMIHAKTAVIDGTWCTIGTANIDRLSMTGNHEINMSITSRQLSAHMENIFFTDLLNARQITRHEWNQRPMVFRVAEKLLRPFAFLV